MESSTLTVSAKRQLTCFVPAAEYAQYVREAAQRGLKLADYIRYKLRGEPLPEARQDDE